MVLASKASLSFPGGIQEVIEEIITNNDIIKKYFI